MNSDQEQKKKSRLFSFKQFSIDDRKSPMKIGTDGVILGAWCAAFAEKNSIKRILDIGTGCGIIALMAAQKSHALIDAIDTDQGAISSAQENFRNSPWNDRLTALHCSLQDFQPHNSIQYDLIVSNPPYFQNSLTSPHEGRTTARHNTSLTFEDLFTHSKRLLSPGGVLIIISPTDLESKVSSIASGTGLFEHKKLYISPSPAHTPVRIISEYSFENCLEPLSLHMCIEMEQRHVFSEEYRELTFDYHPFFN